MINLMDSGDLCQYFSGTYVEYDGKVKYVGEVRGDGNEAEFYNCVDDRWLPMADIQPFYPPTCLVNFNGNTALVGNSGASRDYKRSYRGSGLYGEIDDREKALTEVLNKSWPSFEEALKMCCNHTGGDSYDVAFGRGIFSVRNNPRFKVLLLRYLGRNVGYIFGGGAVIDSAVESSVFNRIRKELGHERVTIED
jgi:hypothetical protein